MRLRDATLVAIAALVVPVLLARAGYVSCDDHSTIRDFAPIAAFAAGESGVLDLFRYEPVPRLPEYIPLRNLSFGLDMRVFGPDPRGMRPQQALWAVAAALAAFWACGRLLAVWAPHLTTEQRRRAALAAGLMFAAHPAHVESVAWLSGRKDLISGAFGALALGFAASPAPDPRCALAYVLCGVCALLGKPTAAAVPLTVALLDAVRGARAFRANAPAHAALGAAAAVVVAALMRETAVQPSDLVGADDLVTASAVWAPLRWGQQLIAFAAIALIPVGLTPVPLSAAAMGDSTADLRVWAGLAALAALVALAVWAARRNRGDVTALLVVWIGLLSPVLAAPPFGHYWAGRYLQLALIAPAAAAGVGLMHLPARARTPVLAVVVTVLTAISAAYAGAWGSDTAFWEQLAAAAPDHAPFRLNAARAHLDAALEPGAAVNRERAAARAHAAHCLRIDPTRAGCAVVTAAFAFSEGRHADGEALLQAVLPHDRLGTAHEALSRRWAQVGRVRDGIALYEGWLRASDFAPARVDHLVRLEIVAGNGARALDRLRRRCLRSSPAARPPGDLARLAVEAARNGPTALRLPRALICRRMDCFVREMGWVDQTASSSSVPTSALKSMPANPAIIGNDE